jgi:hypothetical protein
MLVHGSSLRPRLGGLSHFANGFIARWLTPALEFSSNLVKIPRRRPVSFERQQVWFNAN